MGARHAFPLRSRCGLVRTPQPRVLACVYVCVRWIHSRVARYLTFVGPMQLSSYLLPGREEPRNRGFGRKCYLPEAPESGLRQVRDRCSKILFLSRLD